MFARRVCHDGGNAGDSGSASKVQVRTQHSTPRDAPSAATHHAQASCSECDAEA